MYYLTITLSDIFSNYEFVYIKGPFIDDYEKVLNFQLIQKNDQYYIARLTQRYI